ncbi:MAG: hypothetical protein JKY70_05670 [Mucilaginibacter sp.]|nr:hypothetical protein [Mucilaginibacter sp.]
MKKIIILLLCLIILSNITPLAFLMADNYTYRNYNNKFTFTEESGGHDFKMAKTLYRWYLDKNPQDEKADNKLYRTFKIKPWQFWTWREMIFNHERFSLPYLPLKAGVN